MELYERPNFLRILNIGFDVNNEKFSIRINKTNYKKIDKWRINQIRKITHMLLCLRPNVMIHRYRIVAREKYDRLRIAWINQSQREYAYKCCQCQNIRFGQFF